MIELPVINGSDGVQDKKTCRECGGRCCTSMAGAAWPEDFGPEESMVDTLVSYLSTGSWAVDYWEGDPRPGANELPETLGDDWRCYYVRPANANAIGKLIDASWGGTCVLWNPISGCTIPFSNRPKSCRLLIPSSSGPCQMPDSSMNEKQQSAIAWIPFQKQIREAIERVESGTKK